MAEHNQNMLVPDMNKFKKPMIPKTGGIAVLLSFILSAFVYIFFKTFVLTSNVNIIEVLIIIITIFMAFLIGFIDDIFGWKNSSISGFKKILMTIPVTIPLMVINAGQSWINLPFFGEINLGLIYPLVVVPLAMIGTTNGFNMLAGYNGLESGLGIIILSVLGFVALYTGQFWLALIAGIIVFSLFAFFILNKNPAKILPGNTLTYIIGAFIGCFAILGNMEKAAFILFVPFIIEGFLKLKSKFKAHNMGIPNSDNSLEPRYKKNYSLTHYALRFMKKIRTNGKRNGKAYENDVVYLLFILEMILALFVFFNVLFQVI
jgi:UDP-N-acetylglucosamine--dolichyl-phosphate N-acetylglucosaminephosphotransferase